MHIEFLYPILVSIPLILILEFIPSKYVHAVSVTLALYFIMKHLDNSNWPLEYFGIVVCLVFSVSVLLLIEVVKKRQHKQ